MLKKFKSIAAVMLCLLMVFLVPIQTAEAKTTDKKSVTITLTEEEPLCAYEFLFKKDSKVKVSVKILSVSGKSKEKTVYWGYYDANNGKGSLFYALKTSKFKKNKTLASTEFVDNPYESGTVVFDLPEGMTKLKVKITFSSADGEKVIKSLKETEYY